MSELRKVRKNDIKLLSSAMDQLENYVHSLACMASDYKTRTLMADAPEDDEVYEILFKSINHLREGFKTMSQAEDILEGSYQAAGGRRWFKRK